jgi:hypothetical protein
MEHEYSLTDALRPTGAVESSSRLNGSLPRVLNSVIGRLQGEFPAFVSQARKFAGLLLGIPVS